MKNHHLNDKRGAPPQLLLTYVPAWVSDITDGRIHRGGTKIRVTIRSLGWPHS